MKIKTLSSLFLLVIIPIQLFSQIISHEHKYLKVNFHYILDEDGTGNFNETDDGLGYSGLSGYKHAEETLEWVNHPDRKMALNIPEGNLLGINDKNFTLVLDAVYFHRDSDYENCSKKYEISNKYKINTDEVLNIFVIPNCKSSAIFGTNIAFATFDYARYIDWVDDGSPCCYSPSCPESNDCYSWVMHGFRHAVFHEVAHLLGLKHTVRNPDGTLYPDNNPIDPDGCSDTPSPYEMKHIYGSNHHPACGWGTGNNPGCSNNWMDYSNGTALSPCQINKMHTAMENAFYQHTICYNLESNLIIGVNTINKSQISFYGKTIQLPGLILLGSNIIIDFDEKHDFYFSEAMNLNAGIEIKQGAEVEIIPVYCQE